MEETGNSFEKFRQSLLELSWRLENIDEGTKRFAIDAERLRLLEQGGGEEERTNLHHASYIQEIELQEMLHQPNCNFLEVYSWITERQRTDSLCAYRVQEIVQNFLDRELRHWGAVPDDLLRVVVGLGMYENARKALFLSKTHCLSQFVNAELFHSLLASPTDQAEALAGIFTAGFLNMKEVYERIFGVESFAFVQEGKCWLMNELAKAFARLLPILLEATCLPQYSTCMQSLKIIESDFLPDASPFIPHSLFDCENKAHFTELLRKHTDDWISNVLKPYMQSGNAENAKALRFTKNGILSDRTRSLYVSEHLIQLDIFLAKLATLIGNLPVWIRANHLRKQILHECSYLARQYTAQVLQRKNSSLAENVCYVVDANLHHFGVTLWPQFQALLRQLHVRPKQMPKFELCELSLDFLA